MAVSIVVKLDEADFRKRLEESGNNWAKAMDYTVRTMRKDGPTIIAKNAAEIYNIGQAKLNPRNKTSRGSVSLHGGMKTLTYLYRGSRFPIKEFKGLKPTGPRKKPYTVTAEVLQGQTSKVGHWNKPHSEGGRYSGNSPWMIVPGVPGPVMRMGNKLGGTMRALSVPQMVVNNHNSDETIQELNEKMFDELQRNLARYGLV